MTFNEFHSTASVSFFLFFCNAACQVDFGFVGIFYFAGRPHGDKPI